MQLSMQCTSISLNLIRISNQARRWVERVFSSSMYVSTNQMCKREPPKAGHLLFISLLNKRVVGHFHWAEIRGTRRSAEYHRRSTPCVRCSRVSHVSTFESRASNSNGHLRTTGHDRVRCTPVSCVQRGLQTLDHSPDSCAERVANRSHTKR